MTEIIIDGENGVLGRLASFAAKQALLGKKVDIVNCEKVIILGREVEIVARYKKNRARGGSGLAGPYIHSNPAKIMKSTIRNMLPFKKTRGRMALKRIKCYTGIPHEFNEKKMIKAGRGKKGTTLNHVSKMLEGGEQWKKKE